MHSTMLYVDFCVVFNFSNDAHKIIQKQLTTLFIHHVPPCCNYSFALLLLHVVRSVVIVRSALILV